MVKTGSNLRLKTKLMTMDYESAMRSWMVDPGEDSESDDVDEDDEDGATADVQSMSILGRIAYRRVGRSVL